ncbi:hypothetical protein GGQ22_05015 [Nocardioides sp. zg-579]|uniref:PIN domain-containing protein n=1 Tax=Nocardioides marmotae TaxID=2663857 RepID=A0A6I3JAH4_9ACTN|nr:hypothetical protein [Nocardioides marmotae]MCR6030800.1 hypothetical protein [Gordonia jinghuaiqii]MTB94435.1 hypothetical protein [Nocardioides marmotae]QKE01543.1 hypothetical protein HPC71_10980 [Nocardioides marmotae]
MIGDIRRYLFDNNALFRVPRTMRTSKELRMVVRFPSEVIHEAGPYATRYDLPPLEYMATSSVLRHLKDVMDQVPADDFELIDLYAGEGAADPLLVACALDGAEQRSRVLVGEVYTVVTDDIAVREACERHQVKWMSAADFADELSPRVSD